MTNEKKKSFIMYFDKRAMLDELLKQDGCEALSYERVGRLFIALCDFAEFGTTDVAMDGITRLAYTVLTPRMEDDKEKYLQRCEKNRENVNKRWHNDIQTNTNEYDCIRNDTNYTDTDTDTDTDTESITYIIEYLNQRASANYRVNNQKTRNLIKTRMGEGHSEGDFLTVIDKMCNSWIGTDKEQYLRPQTLFGTKFESYLNAKINTPSNNKTSDSPFDYFLNKAQQYNEGG